MVLTKILNFKLLGNLNKLFYVFFVVLILQLFVPVYAQKVKQEIKKEILEQNFDHQEELEEQPTINEESTKREGSTEPETPQVKIENENEAGSDELTPTVESETETQKPPLLKGHISKVPGGTKLKIILETPVDEITSMVDDEITARIAENIEIDGSVIIPAGSTVIGKISEINLAKRLHKAGSVRIEFQNLTMPDGRQVPILASVLTHSGLIKGKYTKKAALITGATIIGPAAAGFGAGLAAEGSLVGAGIGAAAGTLAGVGLFAFQKGNMVNLRSGDELSIELTEEALVPSGDSEDINEADRNFCDLKSK